jgi:hypothetical protein
MRGRERILLPTDVQLSFVELPPDLGALFEVDLRLCDIFAGRRIGGSGYLIRVVSVDACLDAFFLSETSELVIIKMCRRTAMLAAIAVKPLSWRIGDLLCHGASRVQRERRVPPAARFRCYSGTCRSLSATGVPADLPFLEEIFAGRTWFLRRESRRGPPRLRHPGPRKE